MSKFYELLSNADSKKIVEELYHSELKNALSKQLITCGNWETYNKTDGHITGYFSLENKTCVLDLIVETKYDKNFTIATVKSSVIIQCLFYLHIFLEEGRDLPSVIFIGDKNHCFFFTEIGYLTIFEELILNGKLLHQRLLKSFLIWLLN